MEKYLVINQEVTQVLKSFSTINEAKAYLAYIRIEYKEALKYVPKCTIVHNNEFPLFENN
jgi:hypothetical protein